MTSISYPSLFYYGLFGLPMALVALPIYVYVPGFYAENFGLSLAMIGGALLFARILDALVDPFIGLWIDRQRGKRGYDGMVFLSLPFLILGFIALFHPPQMIESKPFLWLVPSLIFVYFGYSLANISYQSWGAALTQKRALRSSLTSSREGFGLIGVIIASALLGFLNMTWLSFVFVASLLLATFLLIRFAPRPALLIKDVADFSGLSIPLQNIRFRWLLGVFMLNGIAAAIPATLFLFFTNDRLLLPQYAGLFLVLYFLAGALSMPFWSAMAKRSGEKRAWLIAMFLAVAAFVWAFTLDAGNFSGFAIICILSGFSLGADLALPPALLAAVIGESGDMGKKEGSYFGIWNWATKMNLALAAGLALPLLEQMGYQTGTTSAAGLDALAVAYALLPCALKLLSAAILWKAPLENV